RIYQCTVQPIRLRAAAAGSAATTRTAGAARAAASALRSEQRVVRVVRARSRCGFQDHVGDNFGAFLHFRWPLDDFDVRAVRHTETQADLLQLLVFKEPRLSAGLDRRKRSE